MTDILWIACGGTISCCPTERGLSPAVCEKQMKEMLSGLNVPENTNITARLLMNMDSTDMDIPHLKALAEAVYEGRGHSGIIITHGTDTMAYTSAVLACALENISVPVIITGSQRPFFAEGSDGRRNLSSAIAAACDDRFAGVHLLFGDKVIPGDRAVKIHTTDCNAFTSPRGYSAVINGDSFEQVSPLPPPSGECRLREISGNVRLIKLTPFTEESEIISAISDGITGIVLEGFGSCGIPGRLLPAVREAVNRGVTAAFVSQCLYGNTDDKLYEVGVHAGEAGVVFGMDLTAEGALARLAVKK